VHTHSQGVDVNAVYSLPRHHHHHQITTSLQYFCVNATWFRNAYPYLTLKVNPSAMSTVPATWSEELGSIVNRDLDEDSLHPSDFVLVGENVWLLLSRKFGCDVPLSRGVQRRLNKWVVVLSESQTVEIPLSGRFPYESFFGTDVAAAAAVANDDNDADSVDDLVRYGLVVALVCGCSCNECFVVLAVLKSSTAHRDSSRASAYFTVSQYPRFKPRSRPFEHCQQQH